MPSNVEIRNCIPPMFARTMAKLDHKYSIKNDRKATSKVCGHLNPNSFYEVLKHEHNYCLINLVFTFYTHIIN